MKLRTFAAVPLLLGGTVLAGCSSHTPAPTVVVKEVTVAPSSTSATPTTAAKPAPAVTVTKPAPIVTVHAPPRTVIAQPPPQAQIDPWTVVSEYYSDVTSGDYWDAWNLLGTNSQNNQGSYSSFVQGYTGTGTQTTYLVDSNGNTVTYYLESDNPDGTVQWYSGTATVWDGTIQHTDLTQLAGNPNA